MTDDDYDIEDDEDMETEELKTCAFCGAHHWPADETEADSTWQQWQCQTCSQWNDRS